MSGRVRAGRGAVVATIVAVAAAAVATAGCRGGDPPARPPAEPAGPAAPVVERSGAPDRDAGPLYRVDIVAPASCVASQPCAVAVNLTALAGYKVNKEYPFKFVPGAGAGVADATGTFAVDAVDRATMTVTFRPTAAGTSRLEGTFKLSVCSDDTCEIEAAPVTVDIPVT